jgi:hypothetical protein
VSDIEFDRAMDALIGITGAASGLSVLALVALHHWQDPLNQLVAAMAGVGFLAIVVRAAWRLR